MQSDVNEIERKTAGRKKVDKLVNQNKKKEGKDRKEGRKMTKMGK